MRYRFTIDNVNSANVGYYFNRYHQIAEMIVASLAREMNLRVTDFLVEATIFDQEAPHEILIHIQPDLDNGDRIVRLSTVRLTYNLETGE